MALITFATIAATVANVTPEQIGRCAKVFGPDNKAFYMVESEDGKVDEDGYIVEYKVTHSKDRGFQCTCKSGQNGFSNCKKYGVCKHVRWSVACAIEESQALLEQERLSAFQRQDTIVVPVVKAPWGPDEKRESNGLYRSREAGRLAILDVMAAARAIFNR